LGVVIVSRISWWAPLLALALVACGQKHSVDKPIAEVYTALASMPADADAMALATIFPGTSYYVDPASASKVVWHFQRKGADYGRYVAELAADGPARTTVTTHFEEGESETNLSFLRDIARIAGDASVTAALEGKAVDRAAVQAEIRQHIASNPMAAQMATIQTVSDEMDRMAPPDTCKTGTPEEMNRLACQRHGHTIDANGVITRSDTGQVVNSTDE
jgi:hypothetical protein